MGVILILGAADTGRAPMTAAMLRRLLEQRRLAHPVESAGILGHDGDPATGDAIVTMDQMNLDISEHVARMAGDATIGAAALVIAVDSGVARVARARFPDAADRIHTLGELAGRLRDIPDPFKMQIGAWLTYATEIETMLRAALPRIGRLLGEADAEPAAAPAEQPVQAPAPTTPAPTIPEERRLALERIHRRLGVIQGMPDIIDWPAARAQFEHDYMTCGVALVDGDLAPALAGLVRAALSLTAVLPSPEQIAILAEAAHLLEQPVTQAGLAAFSQRIRDWAA